MCGVAQVAQGMLWVWGDSSPAAHIHAAASPAHTVPWMDLKVGTLPGRHSIHPCCKTHVPTPYPTP